MITELTGVENVIRRLQGHPPRLLFVLSGPSGVGKNSIIKDLLERHSEDFARVRTYTTRAPREQEVEGQQYFFVSQAEFQRLSEAGELMERHDVYGSGKLYSMPADPFKDIPERIHLVLAEVDIHGMRLLKQYYEYTVTIFITAPPEDLVQRIQKRADDNLTEQDLIDRMETARDQIRAAQEFDYVVFNRRGQVEQAVQAVETIIFAERMRVRAGFDLAGVMPDEAFSTVLEE